MIFLGLLFDRKEEAKIASKSCGGWVQNQVNAFQWNCLDGFYENGKKDIYIINALPVGTFPRHYKDAVIRPKRWEYRGEMHFQLGTINVPILKQLGRQYACKKVIKKLKDKEIVIYSPYQPYLKAIKHLDKSYKVTLIVPDLPAYYDYNQTSVIKKLLRKLNNRSINSCISRIDRFVLLTEHMKEPLAVGDRPYTVVEGICSGQKIIRKSCKKVDKKGILYTGSLNKQFGIDVLVEAFLQIKEPEYELWICGSGDYEKEVERAAKNDSRIKFFGYVSKEKVLRLQARAAVLVNPRQNTGEYTKYSFPSKIMEYLLSGVPIVAYKLSGIPDEYDAYLKYVKNNSPQALKDALVAVCSDESGMYNCMAERAIDFVLSEKNAKRQAGRILDLIEC